MSIEDGSFTDIGTVPPGTSLAGGSGSLSQRPDTTSFAYVSNTSIPWRGEVINGRGNRGGGMPTGYIATRDGLGLLPADENPHMMYTSLHTTDIATGDSEQIEALDIGLSKFGSTFWTKDGSRLVVSANMPAILEGREHPVYGYTGATVLEMFSPEGEHLGAWSHPLMNAPGNAGFTPLYETSLLVQYGANLTYHLAVVDIADPESEPDDDL